MATITLPAGSTSNDLQAAIDGAASGDIIELSGDMNFSDAVTVPAGLSLTIQSTAGNAWVMIQTAAERHFTVPGALTLENIVLDGSFSGSGGGTQGGLAVTGSLTLAERVTIRNCYANYGGAIQLTGGDLSMQANSTIEGNTGQSRGGGVYASDGATLQMSGGTIANNLVQFDSGTGGGVSLVSDSYFEMSGGLITENTLNLTGNQGGNGGGVSVSGSEFLMSGGTVSYNKSKQYGAGVGIGGGGTFTLTGGLIEYNTAGTAASGHNLSGGGISAINGTVNMSGGTVAHNEAVFGGGVHLGYPGTTSRFNMTGGVIEDNYASAYGGGIQTQSEISFVNIQSTGDPDNVPTIRNNNAGYYGGGILARSSSRVVMDGGEILNNSAIDGGGLWVESNGALDISGASSITGNTAAGNGGGLFTQDYSYSSPASSATYQNITTAPNTIFSGNRASQAYYPPSNAADFTNIGYASTSITASSGYIHPLNNYDVNYEGPEPLALFIVVYDSNGGTGNYADTNIVGGTLYTVLSPEQTNIGRDNYDFAGWNTEPDGSGEYYEPGDQLPVTGDVELYAQWTPAQVLYYVIYDANGGVGRHTDMGLPGDTVYTVLSPVQADISRTGYIFTGWNTRPDGRGTAYQPGDTIVITSNVILYAQWAQVQGPYSVIYDANCGVGGHIDTGLSAGSVYTVLSAAQVGVSRQGYVFTGWNTWPDGIGTAYQPGDTIVITGDVVLYAQWIPVHPGGPCCKRRCSCCCNGGCCCSHCCCR